MRKVLIFAAVSAALYVLFLPLRLQQPSVIYSDRPELESPANPSVEYADNSQVSGNGVVINILSDDNEGDRHQRFILQLPSGNTILIAHNIDRAPRIQTIRNGDVVEFYGVYEWNELGGVVHWTHHDPTGRHQGGWLKHNGQVYQ